MTPYSGFRCGHSQYGDFIVYFLLIFSFVCALSSFTRFPLIIQFSKVRFIIGKMRYAMGLFAYFRNWENSWMLLKVSKYDKVRLMSSVSRERNCSLRFALIESIALLFWAWEESSGFSSRQWCFFFQFRGLNSGSFEIGTPVFEWGELRRYFNFWWWFFPWTHFHSGKIFWNRADLDRSIIRSLLVGLSGILLQIFLGCFVST